MTAILAPAPSPFADLARPAPALARLTLLIALAAVPLALAFALDPRTIEGVPIWQKPLKFHLALAVYLGTLVITARWLPAGFVNRRGYRLYEAYVMFAILAELAWIGGAAAFGTTSHFNVGTPILAIIYGLMGVFAVSLTSLSLVHGIAILRNPATGLPPALRLGIAWGLILTFVLTVPVAGWMSQNDSHFVGTPLNPADGVWLMGWSREVGDLRVAHFLATHAMHAVPLAALLALWLIPRGATPVVAVAALLWVGLTLATFVQALAGLPLLG